MRVHIIHFIFKMNTRSTIISKQLEQQLGYYISCVFIVFQNYLDVNYQMILFNDIDPRLYRNYRV